MRIKFRRGKQRAFLNLVIKNLNSPSLRGLLQFGFLIPYSTLKNYYNESRLLSENLFDDLCMIAKINKSSLSFEVVSENWGKIKGGLFRKAIKKNNL